MDQSIFNPNQQNDRVESKIVVALERISEAFRVLLWQQSKTNSLSPIQIQILIFIEFHAPEKCKVSYLADEFNMTKATISDSVRVLVSKGLLIKRPDPMDTRSFTLAPTPEGKKIIQTTASFATSIQTPIEALTPEQKAVMLDGLLQIIAQLNKAGIITVQRMCHTCMNYRSQNGGHYCTLLKMELANTELRIDCPEHQYAT